MLETTTVSQVQAPRWSGVQALMLAVLDDALQRLQPSQGRERAELEQWFTSREHRYVFSFDVVCESLGLEPSAVRRSLQDTNRTVDPSLGRLRPNVRRSGLIRMTRPAGRAHADRSR
jgi:hypothetical protein